MKLINLTPHAITISTSEGALEIQPSGKVARLEMHQNAYKIIEPDSGHRIGIEIVRHGNLLDLPEPQPDTFYIVSSIVAHTANRRDVVYPGKPFRDENGNVIGCGELLVPETATTLHSGSNTAEILRMDAQGMKQKNIAEALGITQQAVSEALKRHRRNTAFADNELLLIAFSMKVSLDTDDISYKLHLIFNVVSAININRLDEKLKVDRQSISAKLNALTEKEAERLLTRIEAFWDAAPHADNIQGLREAGL